MYKRVRQAKFFLKRSPFQKQRWLVFILLALVGAIATVSLHTTIAICADAPNVATADARILANASLSLTQQRFAIASSNWQVGRLDTGQVVTSQSNSPSSQLLASNFSDQIQQGKELYQAGQFSEAVTAWQKAAATFEAQGDVLNQALTLSFAASAFEPLGQWTKATQAITQSLQLLANNKQQTSDSETLLLSADRQLMLAQVQIG